MSFGCAANAFLFGFLFGNSVMAFSVRTERIDDVWDKELQPDLRQYVINTARDVLREEQSRGFDAHPKTIVDRRHNAAIESVKTYGTIEFLAQAELGEIVDWVYRRLVQVSPVLTRRYVKAHLILVNGSEVSERRLKEIGPGDRVQIVNPLPYARKLEGGARFTGWASRHDRTARRMVAGSSVQAPSGIYRVVFRQAKQRFGKIAFIDYKFVSLEGGLLIPDSKNKRLRYPCIQIYQSANAA
jgi:hypothetical protein